MELRSIQYFVQVADEGSITRAADKLGVAQPALTRHLKRLEAELGTQLLMRLPRGTRSAFSLAELAKTPLILSLGIRALLEQQLSGIAALRVEAEVDSIEAIRRLLLSGVGASIMPVSTFHAEVSARRLVAHAVEDANLHRILVLARPVAEARSAAINEIERIVRAEMNELAQSGLFRLPGTLSGQKRGAR